MNALDYLLADIRAAHKGEKLPRRPAACPHGQAPRPSQAKRPAAPVKPAAKPARPAPAAQPAVDESPAIARALATLRAELGRISP
jgi:hypothetical protein